MPFPSSTCSCVLLCGCDALSKCFALAVLVQCGNFPSFLILWYFKANSFCFVLE